MINKINLLKSVGPFDNVSPHPDTTFKKLTLIYGENGKGKTTLANIFLTSPAAMRFDRASLSWRICGGDFVMRV